VGSWEWDLGSELQIASDELLRILGRPTTGPTLSYKEFVSTVHPDDRESFLQVVERAMRTGESFRQVFRVVMESGEVRTIESHGRIKLDAKGKPVRMFGAAQDITDRERAAQDLRLQAEVLDQLPVAVIATGADRQITLWNDGAETIFAIDREHALGRRLDDLELLAPRSTEVRERMTARLSEGLAWEGEIEVKDANGRIFPALVTNSPIRNELGEIISYVGVTMDMTERRTIESELRLQGQILDHVQSAVVALDHERRVTHWSKGAERLYGWTAEEVVGRPAAELALDGSRSGITRESVQEAVVADGRWEGEIEVRHKDGTTFPVLSTNSAILDASGEMIGFLGISLDISARKQAEEETHEARLETIKRLTRAVETRDPETGGHIERIGEFAAMLAQRLGLSADEVELIRVSSPMHDVGKIGIADEILLKPGPLTPEERSVMERHTKIGHDILAGSHSEILDMAALIALSHHERIDGRGYPLGLEADKIPLEGRIVAVADVFDALTSDRVYRPAFSTAKAIEIMREGRGTQFETQILDLLLGDLEAFSSLVFSNGHPRQPAEAA
jgi:putative two-component system response regulator